MNKKLYLSEKEATEYLCERGVQIAQTTLAAWRYRQNRNLKFYKFGFRVRYNVNDLDAWIESCLRQAVPN